MSDQTQTETAPIVLKPCPFCGGKAEIERMGTPRQSTIYSCTDCGCRLETGEEWSHGRDWNERNPPDAQVSSERLSMIDAIVNGGSALERWERHTGVLTVEDLEAWAKQQLRELLMIRSRRERDGRPAKDELEDYLVGKQAVLSPLLSNLRQITERGAEITPSIPEGNTH